MIGRTGLIGHTGFVGGTLAREASWECCYNSANIETIRDQEFDLLVCAGVSAVKWLANKDPDADTAGIAKLANALEHVRAKELVLISTIDVYPDPAAGGTEDTHIDPAANHPYGRHRLELERWAAARFPVLHIVRLPALFGAGLRKNAIYDMLHDNMTGNINPAGAFQWYPLKRLWRDIGTARALGLPVVNLFPEPLLMSHIIDGLFPGAPVGLETLPAPTYDVQTRHGRSFGGDDRYIMSASAAYAALAEFVAAERVA